MEAEESATVADIREDLDNYGGHLRVFVESAEGDLFEVGAIRSQDKHGETIVIIETGDKA